VHFIYALAAFYLCFYLYSKNRKLPVPWWWAAGLVGAWVLGLIVILALYIQGGSGGYFSDIPMFVAMPLLLCLPQLFPPLTSVFTRRSGKVLLVILFIHGAPVLGYGSYKYLHGMTSDIGENELSRYLSHLRDIRDDESNMDSVVYIPRDESFWESMHLTPLNYGACRATTYTISAIAERPALYSWPSEACYEFLCGPRFHSDGLCEASGEVYTREEALMETRRLGFEKLYLVTEKEVEILY